MSPPRSGPGRFGRGPGNRGPGKRGLTPRRSASSGLRSGLVVLGLCAMLFAAGYLAGFWFSGRPPASSEPPSAPAPQAETPPAKAKKRPPSPPPAPAPVYPPPPSDHVDPESTPITETGPPPPAGGVRVALVIDDLGRSLDDLRILEGLGVPLSYAVLPFESRTAEVVAALQRDRREVLCHLPMEPASGANPGPGALRRDMDREQLVSATRAALAAVPGAVGVNNHMGSEFTTDAQVMRPVLQTLQRQSLFFLDSRTSPHSVGYRLALRLGLRAAQRQVFLDGDPAPEAIRGQFRRLLELARRDGAAIAIGHPYPATLAMLQEEVPLARAQGYEFVPVSYLLDTPERWNEGADE